VRIRALLHIAGISAALAVSGCGCEPSIAPVRSLNFFVTDSTARLDSSLAGTWVWSPAATGDSCDTYSAWTVTLNGDSYRFTPTPESTAVGRNEEQAASLRGLLTTIGAHDYLDVWMDSDDPGLLLPVHQLVRIDRRGDTLTVVTLAYLAFADSTAWNDIAHAQLERDGRILTASTAELRDWIERRFKTSAFATDHSTTHPYQRAVYVRMASPDSVLKWPRR
jgi:hypothetical protein